MRLFALETIGCQLLAMHYHVMPDAIFEETQRQVRGGAEQQTFPGFDPAFSDLLSAEFQLATERLYDIIHRNLEKMRKGPH